MPIRESICHSVDCPLCGRKQEHFHHTSETSAKPCRSCGGETEMVKFSDFKVVFTGAISARYNDRGKEGSDQEGHWAYRTKGVSGEKLAKPEPVFISDWSQQKEFCRSEGLANPRELPRNMNVMQDGKTCESTAGLPGTEI